MAANYALNRLGDIAFRQGDLDGALAYFRQVLELDPDSPLAHHKLGVLQLLKGNRDQAIFHFGAGRN